ncbi:hypothetical protein CANCADRAFT_32320 [Tortispora caseinolytica NRRL Y-17796]|uniref:Prefoldin subunit 5 n=1 Tax=Tortispora caseinolytica NRRL Y-17796 TaxID=767744 RepID=A0A1E4TAR5_9ASCO|nr:hypothetical protein CANCADRAFT_32320 [Tortispora caseinolytica NRRL Y-17796]
MSEVSLEQLPIQELAKIKSSIQNEFESLRNSLEQLLVAQRKFRNCIATAQATVKEENNGKPILVPLTASLYVPGKQIRSDKVLVDIGTGYYTEKTLDETVKFYQHRIDTLDDNLKQLEKLLNEKSSQIQTLDLILVKKLQESRSK